MKQDQLDSIIRARAAREVAAKRLAVDYYRVRQRVSYPLPVPQSVGPRRAIKTSQNYPWAIWMVWALEDRIHSLGFAAEWFGDDAARQAVDRDLRALSQWELQGEHGLVLGHTCRLLAAARRQWKWVDPDLREKIETGLARILKSHLPESEERYAPFSTPA